MATKKAVSKTKRVAVKAVAKVAPKPSIKKVAVQKFAASPKVDNRLVQEKTQDLKQLFSHAVVYIAVNAFLIFVNFATDSKNLWFYWVLIGWGIGLAFHWLDVMNFSPVDEKWVEDEARKILKK